MCELEAYNAMLAGLAAANEGPPKENGERSTEPSKEDRVSRTDGICRIAGQGLTTSLGVSLESLRCESHAG